VGFWSSVTDSTTEEGTRTELGGDIYLKHGYCQTTITDMVDRDDAIEDVETPVPAAEM